MGGDAVYSVPLAPLARDPEAAAAGPRPTLWLFGDSFVGAPDALGREDADLLHNTVARSRCAPDGRFEVDYAWRTEPDGRRRAIFSPARPDRFWWPLGGALHDDRLYVVLLRLESASDSEAGVPFRPVGVDLARVSDPRTDPANWSFDSVPLSRDPDAFPAGAVWIGDRHLHLFGFVQTDPVRRPRFLVRVPLGALETFEAGLREALQTFTDAGWVDGLQAERAAIVMDDDATEMSVARDPSEGSAPGPLRAVYSFPYQGGDGLRGAASDVVYTRTADRPEGPWSPPRALFVIPDLRRDAARGYDPAKRCYAAKAHPGFGTVDRIVVTYVCNLFAWESVGSDALQRLVSRPSVYRPLVVSWPRPEGAP